MDQIEDDWKSTVAVDDVEMVAITSSASEDSVVSITSTYLENHVTQPPAPAPTFHNCILSTSRRLSKMKHRANFEPGV
jgi:hypothetical protein